MKKYLIAFFLLFVFIGSCQETNTKIDDVKFVNYIVNPQKEELKFFWKQNDSSNYGNFQTLKSDLKKQNKDLIFAVNGGMFNKDFSPQGLYIENGVALVDIDTLKNGYGNFYLQPNGVFFLNNKGGPEICKTTDFIKDHSIIYATQSGPMLVIDGTIHSKFTKGSNNVHIRNGVGILPNGKLLFAMSKSKINFYDFASYFKDNGCKNALYLDGFISRTYLPSENMDPLDGNFGVIIAVIKSNK